MKGKTTYRIRKAERKHTVVWQRKDIRKGSVRLQEKGGA